MYQPGRRIVVCILGFFHVKYSLWVCVIFLVVTFDLHNNAIECDFFNFVFLVFSSCTASIIILSLFHMRCLCVCVCVGGGGSLNNIHIFCRQYLMRFSHITHFKRTKQIKVRTKCYLKFLLTHGHTHILTIEFNGIYACCCLHNVTHSIIIWLLCINHHGRKCIEHECKTWISTAVFFLLPKATKY